MVALLFNARSAAFVQPEEPAMPEWAAARKGRTKSYGPIAKYPFATMLVGETFVVPAGPGQPQQQGFRVTCSQKGKNQKKRFVMRVLPDGGYEVCRVA